MGPGGAYEYVYRIMFTQILVYFLYIDIFFYSVARRKVYGCISGLPCFRGEGFFFVRNGIILSH